MPSYGYYRFTLASGQLNLDGLFQVKTFATATASGFLGVDKHQFFLLKTGFIGFECDRFRSKKCQIDRLSLVEVYS